MPADINIWLENLGLGKYAEVFTENEIDFRALPKLSEEDLVALGLPLGARRSLQAAVEELADQLVFLPQRDSSQPSATPTEAERRQLTVMFCDLAGSTELSQTLDPEDLREINRTYQDECTIAIERFDGYVARYMGDGVLAYFGYPRAHEDDAERAIHAGLAITNAIKTLNQNYDDNETVDLGVRVGIATGPVVVGDLIGEGASQESAVVGETPNLAARLQSEADINCVVIGPQTHKLAAGRFVYEDLGKSKLKGIAEAVQLWKVMSASVVESRFEAQQRTDLTPLVGRQHEIGLLLERWAHVREGEGQVVILSGEAGIGKSRIVEMLCENVISDELTLMRYQCSAYHVNSVLHPVIARIERSCGFDSQDAIANKLQKLGSFISKVAGSVPEALFLLARLLSIPLESESDYFKMSPDQQKEKTIEVLVTQISTISAHQPVMVVFEDVHWADPTSLEFLGHLISKLQNLKLLVVITHRPEFSPQWYGPSNITSLTLSRFSRSQALALIEGVTEGKSLPEEIRNQIIEKTDGVPLFLEELTKTVIESGFLEEQDERYILTDSAPSLSIPSTLKDSLMARLDRLAPVREVAQTAAVIGREFDFDLLAEVSPLDSNELEEALEQLKEASLVFRQGSSPNARYAFKHALVRDAAYESLLKANRRNLHAQIASILENRFPGKIETVPELLAHHYSEAGLIEPALKYWLKAGQNSIQKCAYAEAIAQLEGGLSQIEALPEGEEKIQNEIKLRVLLGVPLGSKEGGVSQAYIKNYLKAEALCEQVGETEQLYPILWGRWFHHFLKAEQSQAIQLADRLLQIGQGRNDLALQLEAHHCQWAVQFVGSNLISSLKHCEQGMEIYQIDEHHELTFIFGGHDPGVCARNISGMALWLTGYPDQAKKRLDSSYLLATELAHSASMAEALFMAVELNCLLRDEDALEQSVEMLIEFAELEKILDYKTLIDGLKEWIVFRRDLNSADLTIMRESASKWLDGSIDWTAVPISLIAKALGEFGEIEEGLNLVDEAMSRKPGNELHWFESVLHDVKGELLLLRNTEESRSQAEDILKHAIDLSRKQEAKLMELRATKNLARVLRSNGQTNQAKMLLLPIYNWFTEGFDTLDLRQAKDLLDEMA